MEGPVLPPPDANEGEGITCDVCEEEGRLTGLGQQSVRGSRSRVVVVVGNFLRGSLTLLLYLVTMCKPLHLPSRDSFVCLFTTWFR